ncbi:hypothetical protein HYO65_gp020 [Tenacibaculum phage PTm1]|uniref:Uncharacterized protein n=2 Tax=Shirahamavirus PTm1 TaxID=2846435 RepID=A0A5S9BYY2_9CAUD|nr:hypothetical protein HYO65_gp020 [Tenacibaculum phage PTm1]BBI90412.1 hypothetical protein [Tenacibaculum phage PTm1]BBI90720.1 hypothetical protein [Tenacibaculum phage PTm5]
MLYIYYKTYNYSELWKKMKINKKKIVVSKRSKQRKKVVRQRKSKSEDPNENPLLSRPPKNSVGFNFLQKRNEQAKIQAEISEQVHNEHGLIPERDFRNIEETDNAVPSFVRGLINRYRK